MAVHCDLVLGFFVAFGEGRVVGVLRRAEFFSVCWAPEHGPLSRGQLRRGVGAQLHSSERTPGLFSPLSFDSCLSSPIRVGLTPYEDEKRSGGTHMPTAVKEVCSTRFCGKTEKPTQIWHKHLAH